MENNKYPFRLTKVNWIFAILVACIFTLFFLGRDGINSYSLGYVTGSLIGIAVFPLLVSLVVWLIRGKKLNAGTYTFNIVLGLLCFGMLGDLGEMVKERDISVEKLTDSADEYKEKIRNEEDATEAFEEHSAILNESISNMIRNSSGNEQKVYIKLQEFSTLNQKVMMEWQNSYDSVMTPRILDYEVLNTADEFEYQTNVLRHYLEHTHSYKNHFNTRKAILKDLFSSIPSENETLKGVMTGINKKHSSQLPLVIPFTDAHLSYGKNLIEMLDFLKKSSGQWDFKNNELNFENPEMEQTYLNIIEKIGEDESEINQLTDKLIEVM